MTIFYCVNKIVGIESRGHELYLCKHTGVSGGNEGSLESFHLMRHLVRFEHLYPRVSKPIVAFRSQQVPREKLQIRNVLPEDY